MTNTKRKVTDTSINELINGKYEGMCHTVIDIQGNTTEFNVSVKYQNLIHLGRGGFGVVCSATNIETDTAVAIKKLKWRKGQIRSVLREVQITKYLQESKAVVVLKDILIPANKTEENKWDFETVYLVFELMSTDLHNTIKNETLQLKDDDYRRILVQLLIGVRDIHWAGIIHRDLKPKNILLDKDGKHLKICDFGLARGLRKQVRPLLGGKLMGLSSFDEDTETPAVVIEEVTSKMRKEKKKTGISNGGQGTRGYRAPELALGCEAYGKPADLWSIGCVFAEIVKTTPLFKGRGQNFEDEFNDIIKRLGSSHIKGDLGFIDNKAGLDLAKSAMENSISGIDFEEEFPENLLHSDGLELLKQLLIFDPTKRITAELALKSPYLNGKYNEIKHIFGYPNQEEIKQEVKGSEDEIKKELWKEMEDFHGLNTDKHNTSKFQRML